MVSQLLDPRQPKNLSDCIVLIVIAFHIYLLWALPGSVARPLFAVTFLFWRGCYNVGIGYLLKIQSHHRRLISWARKHSIFENPSTGKQPRPWLYRLLKRELETKIPEDYKFEEAPIEYNTWLVFRRVVDLILMCDFTSYCLFAIACSGRPVNESAAFALARWITGIILVGFNLWVKLDAHRVVKDYAWYWGDFFYLIDQELTFDGVFEMAPHPMYSVGYAGYYGISMMAASYKVLFISIIAHAAQFAFLIYVENPHIEKTYNPPPPRVRNDTVRIETVDASEALANPADVENSRHAVRHENELPERPSSLHNLVGIKNFDSHRVADVAVILLASYCTILAVTTPSTPLYQVIFVIQAVAWRLWYTLGMGIVLKHQSNSKTWTRHFIKWGESTEEAWRQWKGMYHMSMCMCWVSFVTASYKVYSTPEDWAYGLVLLRHVVGVGLIVLQLWISASIYDSLGEFGWFFGDFFFDRAPKQLTYSGIYRYLNNPERILGLAGVWGAALITNSRAVFFLALLSHTATLASIQFVEKPHMEKLYGRRLRKQAGLTKSIRNSLPPPITEWQDRLDKVWDGTSSIVEDFIDAARPKLASGVSTFVKETTALFSHPTRLTITRLAPDLAGYNAKDYSLTVIGTPSTAANQDKFTAKEGQKGRVPSPPYNADHHTLSFEYGAPLRVKWTAPANHSKKDWVGLYMVIDNPSRDVTSLSSAGRWIPTNRTEYDSTTADIGIISADRPIATTVMKGVDGAQLVEGEMLFQGDKLWWTEGVFEFRYHHNGKHNCLAISKPFSIHIPAFSSDPTALTFPAKSNVTEALSASVGSVLLPLVQNCFDRDPEIAPSTLDEGFGSLVERDAKYAKRVVFAIRQMFGIEFAEGVVVADGSVRKLAWRIVHAKEILVSLLTVG